HSSTDPSVSTTSTTPARRCSPRPRSNARKSSSPRGSTHRTPPAFPTRRSSDLKHLAFVGLRTRGVSRAHRLAAKIAHIDGTTLRSEEHTSNSSHVSTSYAVFCSKKKTTYQDAPRGAG